MSPRISTAVRVLVCAQVFAAAALAQPEERIRSGTVRDLAYGEVLYDYYQEDYFGALTRLLAARSRQEISHHAGEAELLLGGLYLSFGQHRRAAEIFDRLLDRSADVSLRDRAWYFLAKIWYQRGYLGEAQQALERVGADLPDDLEAERRLLEARVMMDQGRFDAALDVLARWEEPADEWVGYAKFNIGVALVRLGRVEEGAAVLEEVGRLPAGGGALGALRDKANVALGYAWLQAGRPDRALLPLQRVRLEGPSSNKALLGVGWSDAELGEYRAALSPWLELSARSVLDPAVQEALLAVPYAFGRLGANKQAADHYLGAIDTFNKEIGRVDAAIRSVERGELLEALLDDRVTDASGWYWRLQEIPDSVETRYLFPLLASNEFQEGLKSYRDLRYLRENLRRWSESLGAFDDILETRQRAYEQRLPTIRRSLDSVDLDALAARRVAGESRLMDIERDENVQSLGTEQEQAAWSTLQAMSTKLDLVGDMPGADELREKRRFLSGILYWRMAREYKARLWQAKKGLAAVEREFRAARRSYRRVDAVRAEWPARFEALTGRIAGLAPRLDALDRSLEDLAARQADFLERLAARALLAQRDRLSDYLVQARFALASVYDRSAAPGSAAEPVEAASGEDSR